MAYGECPSPREDCRQEVPFSDEHHKYYPASRYCGWLAIKFRNLPDNKEQICRCQHEDIQCLEPPDKPTRKVMQAAIKQAYLDGRISLTKKQRRLLGL